MQIVEPHLSHVIPLFRALHTFHAEIRPDAYHCDGTDADFARILHDICDTGGRVFAHDAGWGLVSYVAARPEDRPRTALRCRRSAMVIEHLYIAPQVRGLGLGRALVAEVARWAVELGLSRWQVSHEAENSAAADFYDGLGARAQAVVRSKTLAM